MAKQNTAETEEKTESGDAPLIDLNEASIKKLIARAKKRGVITYDELNDALPQDQMSSEQIEDIMSALNDMGVNIVENDDSDEDGEAEEAGADVEEVGEEGTEGERFVIEKKKETVDRTDDPVRMYLREMGAVELLSREGEIAIAKRIEAGRDMMIGGLCESPQTFKAIISWHDAVKEGRMLLRDVIDLEATAAAENPDAAAPDPDEEFEEGEEGEGMGRSRSALEEKLKPEALAAFQAIEANYGKLQKMQLKRMEAYTAGEELQTRSEKTYEKTRAELVGMVQKVHLHN